MGCEGNIFSFHKHSFSHAHTHRSSHTGGFMYPPFIAVLNIVWLGLVRLYLNFKVKENLSDFPLLQNYECLLVWYNFKMETSNNEHFQELRLKTNKHYCYLWSFLKRCSHFSQSYLYDYYLIIIVKNVTWMLIQTSSYVNMSQFRQKGWWMLLGSNIKIKPSKKQNNSSGIKETSN